MASDIGVKMGVSGIENFKKGMAIATQNVKSLDAALKLNEKQLQATGDKETYMQQKSKLLKQQIAEQNTVIKQGQQALAAMEKNGVTPASAAYQKMQQQVLNSKAALIDMQRDLDGVGSRAQETAQKTDKLAESLNGINKKVNFDVVLGGIGKITDGMEAAARRVGHLAGNIWDTMLEAAAWADDIGTEAELYGMGAEELQRRKQVAEIIQTPVEAIEKAKQKLNKNLSEMSDSAMDTLQTLGFVVSGKYGEKAFTSDWLEADTTEKKLFKIGAALLALDDEMQQSAMAQELLGQSWQTMLPLFNAGETKYNELMEAQNVVSQENVDRLGELSLKVKEMDTQWNILKRTVEGEVAESFSTLAGAVGDVLRQFNEYLATPEGQQKLHDLGEALSSIFGDLSDTDVSGAVNLLGTALDKVTEGLRFIADNKKEIIEGIEGIGVAFVGLKFAEALGSLAQGANALKQLFGGGGKAAGGGASAPAVVPTTNGSAAASNSAFVAGAKKFLSQAAGLLVDASPLAFLFDSVRQTIENNQAAREWMQEAQEYAAAREQEVENLQGGADFETLKAVWKRLSEAISSGNAGKSGAFLADFADMYSRWTYEDFPELDAVFDNISEETADKFTGMMEKALSGENLDPYAVIDMLNAIMQQLDTAISEQGDGLKVKTSPELPEDAAEQLQQKLSSYRLEVMVAPILGRMSASLGYSLGVDGFHANGLPFVPFDGYIAALHKGERIVPAEVNKSRTFTSNVYFDHTSLNNGIDAEGLAAKISEANRRTLAGFGS